MTMPAGFRFAVGSELLKRATRFKLAVLPFRTPQPRHCGVHPLHGLFPPTAYAYPASFSHADDAEADEGRDSSDDVPTSFDADAEEIAHLQGVIAKSMAQLNLKRKKS